MAPCSLENTYKHQSNTLPGTGTFKHAAEKLANDAIDGNDPELACTPERIRVAETTAIWALGATRSVHQHNEDRSTETAAAEQDSGADQIVSGTEEDSGSFCGETSTPPLTDRSRVQILPPRTCFFCHRDSTTFQPPSELAKHMRDKHKDADPSDSFKLLNQISSCIYCRDIYATAGISKHLRSCKSRKDVDVSCDHDESTNRNQPNLGNFLRKKL